MNAIDLKRAEFRQYLESTGVMEALSYALIKLYDESAKPKDPIAFVREHFKRPNDHNVDNVINIEASEATELFNKQQNELESARQEISKLRHTLNAMADHSPAIKSLERALGCNSIPYQSIFNDSAYETTLVKKYLTENMFESFTEYDNKPTIVDCIVKANALDSHPLGIIALNGDCYTKFSELFEPIIKEINGLENSSKMQPDSDWGDNNNQFEPLHSDRIVSIGISCSRSLIGFNFISEMNEQDLENVLTTVQNAIQSNRSGDEEIDGEFYKITDVKETEPIFDDLQTFGLGFQSMNPKDHPLWPVGRGLYINCARTQSILINEDEHLRFVCAETNDDFGSVYRNLKLLVEKFGEGLKFERNNKFGWLTTNVNRLGTTLSCRIKIRLDNKPIECLMDICQKYHIEITLLNGLDGAQVVELSNNASFGLTEIEYMNTFYGHLKEVIGVLESDNNEENAENNCNDQTVETIESDENKVEEISKEKEGASPNDIENVEEPLIENPKGQNDENEEIRPEDPIENENIKCPEITNEVEASEEN